MDKQLKVAGRKGIHKLFDPERNGDPIELLSRSSSLGVDGHVCFHPHRKRFPCFHGNSRACSVES